LQTTEHLNLHQEESDVISFLKKAFPRKFPGIKTIPTTETEIKSIIYLGVRPSFEAHDVFFLFFS
jgi:hypothetical protein